MAAQKIGVVLSGAGYLDGAEIHESVLTLLYLDEMGANVQVFAPNIQLKEVDHQTGRETGQERNVLQEAARISRGNVRDIESVKASDMAGWVFPGGFGAAKNLSSFAADGANAQVLPHVSRIINEALEARLPIAACCIAPSLLALVTKNRTPGITLTIGSDENTAKALTDLGVTHKRCEVTDCVIDCEHKIVTAPAYMCEARISDIAQGIRKMIAQLVTWTK